ncbi:hypothetical protein B0H17DRAFT_1211699 [Mycena rosella]|uniref:Uncharacterized protein n=1 Tax=Mycena rosella TaxID=1033263 RepID=A0AAD7CTY1_MYCRO|nr:hypothetical protein B0H17DRAFT_1211699 [Mycena rosella]
MDNVFLAAVHISLLAQADNILLVLCQRFLPRPSSADTNLSSDESSLTLSSLSSSRTLTPSSPATSPAPDPLHGAATAVPTVPQPHLDDLMTDINPKLFKGDGVGENTTDFLNSMRRRNLVSPNWKDPEKLEFFELSLKSGSFAKRWFNKLDPTQEDTFAHLSAVFQAQWPEKEMAKKEKGELQEKLLAIVLDAKDVGMRIEDDGIQEWGHVRWSLKVAELGARIDAGGSLISLALKNIPGSLILRLGPKRGT